MSFSHSGFRFLKRSNFPSSLLIFQNSLEASETLFFIITCDDITFLLISLFIMPFGSYIFIFLTNHFIEYFPDIPLKLKIESYFLGYWALEYFDDRTWKALVQFYTERALYLVVLLYFIVTKNKNSYRPYVISFLILINVLFSFPNLSVVNVAPFTVP